MLKIPKEILGCADLLAFQQQMQGAAEMPCKLTISEELHRLKSVVAEAKYYLEVEQRMANKENVAPSTSGASSSGSDPSART